MQVIYVGDQAMLHRLRNGKRWHKRQVRNALAGSELPALPASEGADDASLAQVGGKVAIACRVKNDILL